MCVQLNECSECNETYSQTELTILKQNSDLKKNEKKNVIFKTDKS